RKPSDEAHRSPQARDQEATENPVPAQERNGLRDERTRCCAGSGLGPCTGFQFGTRVGSGFGFHIGTAGRHREERSQTAYSKARRNAQPDRGRARRRGSSRRSRRRVGLPAESTRLGIVPASAPRNESESVYNTKAIGYTCFTFPVRDFGGWHGK